MSTMMITMIAVTKVVIKAMNAEDGCNKRIVGYTSALYPSFSLLLYTAPPHIRRGCFIERKHVYYVCVYTVPSSDLIFAVGEKLWVLVAVVMIAVMIVIRKGVKGREGEWGGYKYPSPLFCSSSYYPHYTGYVPKKSTTI